MTIEFNMVQSLGFAVVLLVIGRQIKKHVYFFQRFAIPSPVIGGFLFAIINLILYVTGTVEFVFDATLQTFFMTLFFTSIGLGASPKILKKAGPKVLLFLLVAAGLCVLQNAVALGLAPVVGVSEGIALMTGSTPMTGGHGTSGGIAPLLEESGIVGAQTVAYTAATFGLIAGSLMGGPLADHVIRKYDLVKKHHEAIAAGEIDNSILNEKTPELNGNRVLKAFMVMLIAMFLGSYITESLNGVVQNFTDKAAFPAYLGPMLFGVVARAISDSFSKKGNELVPHQEVEILGTTSLSLFLSMALMTVQLWQLADLAVPLLILLAAQTLLMFLYSRFVTFKVMGGNYDAAVLMGGHCGFGMGATPNGVANMESIVTKYVDSKMAFFVLPVVGSMFIDFVNIIIITLFIGLV